MRSDRFHRARAKHYHRSNAASNQRHDTWVSKKRQIVPEPPLPERLQKSDWYLDDCDLPGVVVAEQPDPVIFEICRSRWWSCWTS